MGGKNRGSYKNSQEYIKLQSEITRLNAKLQELYDKKKKIKLYNEKVSKINKMYLIILVTFEIFMVIISRGALLIIQSFVVVGLSFIGFDTSKKVYVEGKKLKADNGEIDLEIENTEGELKRAKGELDVYVKRKEKEEMISRGESDSQEKTIEAPLFQNDFVDSNNNVNSSGNGLIKVKVLPNDDEY